MKKSVADFSKEKKSQRDFIFPSLANSVPYRAPEEFHHSLQKAVPKGRAGRRRKAEGGCTGISALQRQVFSGVLIWSYSKLNCRTLSLNGEEASFITSFVFQWVCSFKVAGCECRKRHSKNQESAKFQLLYETTKMKIKLIDSIFIYISCPAVEYYFPCLQGPF